MEKKSDMSFQKEILAEMFRKMLLIRRFEEKVSYLWSKSLIPGLIHLYIGEEAVAVGSCIDLRIDDYIVSTHRGHGHCLAKGGDPKRMMAELLGRITGYCKGKGGSMHVCAPDIGVVGCSGIAGAGLPIAAGVGLSISLRKTDQVCVCFFGDGSANTGAFHEGVNMASVWRLPLVYVCENNQYAISVPMRKSTAVNDIAVRAQAYGIPGATIDGMDVLAVQKEVTSAINRARKGDGPTLIECKTYRFRGHWEGDPKMGATYRDESEVEKWRERDPIQKLKTKLIVEEILTENEINKIEKNVEFEIEDAAKFAIDSPIPAVTALKEDLFA